MTTFETTTTTRGKMRLEAILNALFENIETEIEQANAKAEKWKQDAVYWQEQFSKEKTERERQMHLLRTVFQASEPAPCQG